MTEFDGQGSTYRLFNAPSFLEGMAMAADVSGTMPEFNTSENSNLADSLAIASDWRAVASDLRSVFDAVTVRIR